MRPIEVYLNICIDDKKTLDSLYKALVPEVESKPSKERGEAYLDKGNECVLLRLVARDISSLRAMLNGYLYLVHAISNTIDVVRRSM